MHRKNITVDGIKLSYLEAGEGKTVLLLHGGGTEASTYSHLIKYLAKGYHVVTPDIPFFGRSSAPKTAYDYDDYAKLFISFLTALNLKEVIVIGYSFGGGIGMRMHEDSRVAQTILCSPAVQNLKIDTKGLAQMVKKEFLLSMKNIKSISELLLFLKVDLDFVKNIVKCKDKDLLLKSVILCLNQDYDTSTYNGITLAVSDKDPIFSKAKYAKMSDKKQLVHLKGGHLWFLIKKQEFEKIYQLLDSR